MTLRHSFTSRHLGSAFIFCHCRTSRSSKVNCGAAVVFLRMKACVVVVAGRWVAAGRWVVASQVSRATIGMDSRKDADVLVYLHM